MSFTPPHVQLAENLQTVNWILQIKTTICSMTLFSSLKRRSSLKTCVSTCIAISAVILLFHVCNSYSSIMYFIYDWECAIFRTVRNYGIRGLTDFRLCASHLPVENTGKPSQDLKKTAFNLSRMMTKSFGNNNNKFITVYDCMCDERFKPQISPQSTFLSSQKASDSHSQQLSLIFQVSINGYVGEVDDSWSIIGRKWSCSYQFNQSDHSNLPQRAPIGYIGGRKDGCPYLNTLSYAIGVIICYLDPKIKVCPSYASLLTGGKYELVQNTVKVTRQTKGPRTNVALCTHAPLPIPNSNFLSWHRFVETIEHHLMTGIEVVIMPKPWNLTDYPLPKDLQRAIDFYVNRGSLRLLDLPYYVEGHSGIPKGENDVYLMMDSIKIWHVTHCYLRHSLEFKYITVMDLDEVVGFNMDRYPQGVNQLLEQLEKHYNSDSCSSRAFQLTDRRMLTTSCQAIVHNISSARLDRITKTLNTSWHNWSILTRNIARRTAQHRGKAIIHSDACLIVYQHGCSRFVPQHPSVHFNREELFGIQDEIFYRRIDAERFGVYSYHYRECNSSSEDCCSHSGGLADYYHPKNEQMLLDRVYKATSRLFGT
ncbi:uncharacterized protein LOC142348404 isoform X1 [Convolutriloba macropyga]|uniref:uncharacterized protein LOC142348404 isoform X1 n=1 Tax=Convolutriloba macropyga TaxID=536237 RepID=UPI003F51EDB7